MTLLPERVLILQMYIPFVSPLKSIVPVQLMPLATSSPLVL